MLSPVNTLTKSIIMENNLKFTTLLGICLEMRLEERLGERLEQRLELRLEERLDALLGVRLCKRSNRGKRAILRV